jgi:molybdate transport system substrate-binding protein
MWMKALAACGMAIQLSSSQPPPRPAITVSAAISLAQALEEIGRAYEAAGGGTVRFNFAGSNVLARQIVNGAPVDLFISADEAQMRVVEDAGGIVRGSRAALVGNRLAVAVAAGAPAIEDASGLRRPEFRRIALGDPAAVPAGVYAKAYLEAAGVWAHITGRIVPLENVRAAVTAVDSGSADAAIVYESDLSSLRRARIAFVVSGPNAPRIEYPAAIVSGSRNRAAAEQFLKFLRSEEAGAVFRRYRFQPRAT